FYRYGFVANF
nr:Chain C, RNA-directed RNA polymerase catalytic subunit [Influenza A virus H3N2]